MNLNCDALLKLPKVKLRMLLIQEKLSYMKWNGGGDDDDHYNSNTSNNNSIMSSQEIPRVHFPQ